MRALISGLVMAAALTVSAQAADRQFPVDAKPVLEDRYPQQVAKWPGGVTSLADVTYSTIPGYRPMVVDIYMPPKKGGPKPLVLYIHGGGWVAGHTRHSGALANFPAALAKLASEGFVVASLEYRLADEARFPAQLQDARAALRFLKSNAAKYGIDPSRSGVWGGSAGGHLAALTALTCGVSYLDPAGLKADPGSECVQAAVTWYGVFDFGGLERRHFFLQAALGSLGHGFARLGMTAAGVRPQTRTVVLIVGPLLEQPFAFAVEYKYAESPVQEPFFVGFHFFHNAQCFVEFVYENYVHKTVYKILS